MKRLNGFGWAASCALLLASACGDDDGAVSPPLTNDAGPDAGETSGETSDETTDPTSGEAGTGETSDQTDETSDQTTDQSETSAETSTSAVDAGGDASPDSGPPDGEAPDADTGEPYQIEVSVTGDLVGAPVDVEAQGTAGGDAAEVDYAWEVVNVPAESDLTTEGLSGADSEQVQFSPDRAGTYTLRITVDGDLGTASRLYDVVVRGYDVAYWSIQGNDEEYTTVASMVRSDGANPRPVGCPRVEAATSESDWLGTVQGLGQLAMSPHMPGPSETSRMAWAYADGEDVYKMSIGHSTTDCEDAVPVEVDGGQRMAFALDGSRVAFTRLVEEGETATVSIFTVANDGADMRTIRSDAEPTVSVLYGVPITWTDGGSLVWSEEVDSDEDGRSVVYRADDVEGAFGEEEHLSILLDCRGADNPISGIREVFLRGGNLIVAAVQASLDSTSRTIWNIGADDIGVRSCESDADTNVAITDDNAFDLDVTPDGSHVVYYAREEGSEVTTHLYVAASDGSGEPLLISGGDEVANVGAHFAAGGRQVVWSKTLFELFEPDSGAESYERPVSSAVWVVNVDGTGARKLVETLSTPGSAKMVHTGGSGGFCSMGTSGTPGAALFGLLFGLGALWVRRRPQ